MSHREPAMNDRSDQQLAHRPPCCSIDAPQLIHCGGINTSSAKSRVVRNARITEAADVGQSAISPFDLDIVRIQSATDQPVKAMGLDRGRRCEPKDVSWFCSIRSLGPPRSRSLAGNGKLIACQYRGDCIEAMRRKLPQLSFNYCRRPAETSAAPQPDLCLRPPPPGKPAPIDSRK